MVGYEGLYLVSNYGEVKNIKTDKISKGTVNKNGYIKISLTKDGKLSNKLIHRLVAEAFIPNTDNKPMVNHIDENPSNCMVNNLEWVTANENANHGTRNYRISKIKSSTVCEYDLCGNIIRIWKNPRFVADYYNISTRVVQLSCKNKTFISIGRAFRYFNLGDELQLSIQPCTDKELDKLKHGSRSHYIDEQINNPNKEHIIEIDSLLSNTVNCQKINSLDIIYKDMIFDLETSGKISPQNILKLYNI